MRIARLELLLPALLIASLFSTLSYAAAPDRIAGALTGGPTVTLKGNVHHKALPKYDQGPADPALRLGTMMLLTMPTASQQKDLKELLVQQQDRRSPNYRKWLTPEQWADRFGLSENDAQKIAAWLKSLGLGNVSTAHARNWFSFTGTAAQVQRAFGTEIHHYSVGGEMHFANATAPKIPMALSSMGVSFRGLDDFRPKPMNARKTLKANLRADYYDSAFPADFTAPGDIETIYDLKPLYDAGITGAGQKLVIVGQTDVYLADLNDFRSGFGLPLITGCSTDSNGVITGAACNTSNFVYLLYGTDPGVFSDITEADLDLEWSAATAPGAKILYVNSTNVFNSYYNAINDNLAPVISMSYGLCEFDDNNLPNDEIELAQANSQGITFLNSSGDSGSAECDPVPPPNNDPNNLAIGGLAVSYPASSPSITGVGATAIVYPSGFSSTYWTSPVTNPANGGTAQNPPLPEKSWNDNEDLVPLFPAGTTALSLQQTYGISQGGGGASNCSVQTVDFGDCVSGFGQPWWQSLTIPSVTTHARYSPDVSLLGSPNFPGYIFCVPLNAWINSTSTASSCAPGGSAGITNALALIDPTQAPPNNQHPTVVGGTSASTPVFAAMVTLLNQFLQTDGLGNINPTLYGLASTPANGVFHRITSGDNNVYCRAGTPTSTTQDPWPVALQCPTAGVFGYSATNSDATTGYNLVTGLGSVDANNLIHQWDTAPLPPDFTLTPTVATFQVTQGSNVNATVDVELASGFAGTVSFTCTDAAPQSTCTAPPSITASGQVSFAITTTRPTADLRRPFDRGTRIFYAALLPGLLGVVFMAGTRKRSTRGIRLLGLIVVLGFSTLWLASCGGSSNHGVTNQGTPKGSYTITVTGTSGTTAIPTSFQITVQ